MEYLKRWFHDISYQEAKELIREKLESMSRTFIATGYYLRLIRDSEAYKQDGYKDIWEFAEDQYGIKRSTTSRWISMNERFSEDGNSPNLAEAYREYGKSQLQEMLYLTDDQMDEVSPDMTVKDIRGIRNAENIENDEQVDGQMSVNDYPELLPEEPVSVLGYPLRVYPQDSLAGVPGCGKLDCYSCHRDGCGLRQEDCYCVEATMENPYPCLTLNMVDSIRQDVGNRCQFVNEDLAFHRAGDGQPVPCCKKCPEPCGYECAASKRNRIEKAGDALKAGLADGMENVSESAQELAENISNAGREELCDVAHEQDVPENDSDQHENVIKTEESVIEEQERTSGQWNLIFVRDHLFEEEKNLNEYLQVDGLPQAVLLKQEALVRGLRLILDEAERDKEECEETDLDESAVMQPKLPALKNMEQREQFVLGYRTWPVWCRNELTEETYYRYNLPDKSAIVVREFPYYGYWEEDKIKAGKTLFLLKEGIKSFKDGETNMTTLKEHLKNVQKGDR